MHADATQPLNERKAELEKALADLDADILERAREKLAEYEATWTRVPVDRTGTEDRFEPVTAKFVRLVCEAQDGNPKSASGFGIDEFEVWSAARVRRTLHWPATAVRQPGNARKIEDFPGAYGPQLPSTERPAPGSFPRAPT